MRLVFVQRFLTKFQFREILEQLRIKLVHGCFAVKFMKYFRTVIFLRTSDVKKRDTGTGVFLRILLNF